jgi:hypothetical protein
MKQKTALKFRGVSAVGGTLNEAAVSFAQVIMGKSRQLIVSSDNGVYAVNPLADVQFFDPKLGVEHARVLKKELGLVLASDGEGGEGIRAYTAECSECAEVVLTEKKLENCLLCGSGIEAASYEQIELQMPSSEELQLAQASNSGDLVVTESSDEDEDEDVEAEEDDSDEDEDAGDADEDDSDEDEAADEDEGDEEVVTEDDEDADDEDADADVDGDTEDEVDEDDAEDVDSEEAGDDDADIELPDEDEDDAEEASDDEEVIEDDADEDLGDEDDADEDAGDDEEVVEEASADDAYYINDEGSVDIDMVNDTLAEDGDVTSVEYSCSSTGAKRWIAAVGIQPVAYITEASAGNNKAIFHTEAFAKVANAVLASDGVKGLLGIGFTPFVIQAPIRSLIASQVEAETASVKADYRKQSEALAKDFSSAMCLAAAGINRGFFADVVNPLKVKMWQELSALGIPSPERIMDRCFKETAEAFCQTLVDKASELHAKPRAVRIELSQAIAGTNYMDVVESEDEEPESVSEALASQMETTAVPFSSFSRGNHPLHEETASASSFDTDLGAVMKSL